MIETKVGDCLAIPRGIIVHGCNCQGAMGSGIALSVRNKWPAVFAAYHKQYTTMGLALGSVVTVGGIPNNWPDATTRFVHEVTPQLPPEVFVVNLMSQFVYGKDPSVVYCDYDAIEAGFMQVKLLAKATGLPVHFPLLGCGLANGKWEEVSARIERALGPDVEKVLWTWPAA